MLREFDVSFGLRLYMRSTSKAEYGQRAIERVALTGSRVLSEDVTEEALNLVAGLGNELRGFVEQYREEDQWPVLWSKFKLWKMNVLEELAPFVPDTRLVHFRNLSMGPSGGLVFSHRDRLQPLLNHGAMLFALQEDIEQNPEKFGKAVVRQAKQKTHSAAVDAVPLRKPATVTLKWLWENVPAPLMTAFVGTLVAAFLAGSAFPGIAAAIKALFR